MPAALPAGCLPEVAEFLGKSPLKAVVGGKDVKPPAASGLSPAIRARGNRWPSSPPCKPTTSIRPSGRRRPPSTIRRWARLSPNDRGVLLHRLADAVEKRKEIVAQIEVARRRQGAGPGRGRRAELHRHAALLHRHVHAHPAPHALAVNGHEAWTVRHPWGPCGFIFPWNFPILLIGWNIAPALAAGNTVVIKPAEDTPLSAIYLARLAREVGIPDGVINVVPGYGNAAGAALAAHPRLEADVVHRFAGSGPPDRRGLRAEPRAGQAGTGRQGGGGGLRRRPRRQTAEKLVGAITFHTGQVCCDATRWIVQRPIYDALRGGLRRSLAAGPHRASLGRRRRRWGRW